MRKTLLKLTLSFLAVLFWSAGLYAQTTRTISGTVKDENGGPLPAVSVTVKETKKSASTNAEGQYSISAQTGNTLVFTYIGYKAQEINIGTSSTVNISLQPSDSELSEVTVTALGIAKKNTQLGYSVTTVKGDEIARTNTINPITALQGKVAGVSINVIGTSGVQSSPNILIRGATSPYNAGDPGKNRNQPIFVVDGIVLQNNTTDYAEADNGTQLKNLNPDDYESITVLKGAAATSIYGSRGANGAIVITSKKGKLGTGLGIEVNSTYQVQNTYKNGLELQDVYGMGSWATREGNFRPDGTQALTGYSFGPKMDGSLKAAPYDQTKMVPYSPQPDNWKTFNSNGYYANNHIALTGGGEKFTYRLSYSNLNNKGQLPNNKLDRNNFDFRTTGQLNNVFSIDAGISYAITHSLNPINQSRDFFTSGQNIGFLTYYELPRNANIAEWKENSKNPDGSRRSYGADGFNRLNGAFNRMDYIDNNRKENSILANFQLKAQVTPWFDMSGRINLNSYKIFTENKEKGAGAFGAGGAYGLSGNYTSGYNALFMAHANKKFLNDDLNIDFRLINEYYGNGRSESYGSRTDGGLQVPNVFALSNSVNALTNFRSYNYATPNEKVIAAAGILNVNYKEYLNLELTGRNDWLSTLIYPDGVPGENNYTVFYPSANLSWGFSDMWRDKMPQWLSFGKLRASIAWAGTGTAAFGTSFGSYLPAAILDQNGNSVITAPLQNANILPNLDLKPEIKRSLEFGTELAFLGNRISVDAAWYRTNTFNQILDIPNTVETGYAFKRINAGNIQNQGIELLLNVSPIRKKDFAWDMSFNFTRNRSKIVSFYPGVTERELLDAYRGSGVTVHAYEGGAFGVMTTQGSMRKYDPATGLPILTIPRDANGVPVRVTDLNPDSKYDFADYAWAQQTFSGNDRANLGKIEPDFLAGFNTTVRYKNLSLYVQLDSRIGGVVYSEAYNYGMFRGNLKNSLQYRDQEHGGVARTDSYTGKTIYDGAIPNAVFAAGETSPIDPTKNIGGMTFQQAYEANLVEPWKAGRYYIRTYGFQTNFDNGSVSKNSWVMLREINLGYTLPKDLVNKVRLNGVRINVSARNIGYLYRTLVGGQNPESIQGNNPFMPIITGAAPFVRNYAVSLNLTL